jgi:sulfoxide reductase heme-binding subunit YedZ
LGLFAFFYAFLHFCIYIVLDKFFDWPEIVKDVTKRPFITVGFLAFVLMIPLAVTSTAWAIRKMGGKNWSLLHRAIYISAVAGVVHFWWKVKADHREPAVFAVIVAVLLVYRVAVWARSRIVTRSTPTAKPALVGE